MNQSNRAFVDMCVFIATYHPASRRIDYENDVCIKSGIRSFKDSLEYRDKYMLISIALDDSAVFVEYIQPIEKLVVLIDGVGSVITLDSDYQYLLNYVVTLYQKVLKSVKEKELENSSL